jgi:hypothetical protein
MAVLAGLLLISMAAGASTYRRMTLDALVQSSAFVVYGRIVDSRPAWDAATRMIWTHTCIQVLEGLKGLPGTTVTITEPGGIVSGMGQYYPGTPQFRVGQEAVVFIYRAPGNRLRVTGALQGVYGIRTDPSTGEKLAIPAVPHPEVVYEEGSPAMRAERQQSPGFEGLSRFLHTIRQKAAGR